MSNEMLQLLIFAALAAVVLYQLYAVLGRRVGRQPEDNNEAPAPPAPLTAPEPSEGVALVGLPAIKARDPAFDLNHFLGGARSAYEMIVRAFADGDRATLGGLLAPPVMDAFDKAIAAREAEGRTEAVEFTHAPRADFEQASVDGDAARVTVRFLAEFRSRSKGPEGEAVDDRRTAELWTFERNLNSPDPNWTLVRVDAAEA
jgi:predicted lipid-binding transport protein (Tim44 family)